MRFRALFSVSLGYLLCAASALASPQATAQTSTIPAALFRMSGTLLTPAGEPRTGQVVLIASVYSDATDPTPLWTEVQLVDLMTGGRYAINVGATLDGGVPKELFVSGSARWIGVAVQGEPEQQPRTMLASQAYAVKAVDADTLGGKTPLELFSSREFSSSVKSVFATPSGSLVTTNAVTSNFMPKFTDGAGTLGNSAMVDVSGNIGVGTTTPADLFDVKGLMRMTGTAGSPNYIRFDNTANAASGGKIWRFGNSGANGLGSFDIYNQTDNVLGLTITSNGNVGLGGILAPSDQVEVQGILKMTGTLGSPNYIRFDNTPNAVYGGKMWRFGNTGAVSTSSFDIYNQTDNLLVITALPSGNVGIGTTTPTAKLDVNGNINVSGNINAKYQDVAEWVETSAPLEDGTVVIVDPAEPNHVVASSKAYDTRVAGAVSRQPGLVLGERGDGKAMVAANGRVRIKVDASYGAVNIGDLLVTSSTPGYAMVSRPITVGGQTFHRAGTLLGKALEAMPNGKGEILVLLMLQ